MKVASLCIAGSHFATLRPLATIILELLHVYLHEAISQKKVAKVAMVARTARPMTTCHYGRMEPKATTSGHGKAAFLFDVRHSCPCEIRENRRLRGRDRLLGKG